MQNLRTAHLFIEGVAVEGNNEIRSLPIDLARQKVVFVRAITIHALHMNTVRPLFYELRQAIIKLELREHGLRIDRAGRIDRMPNHETAFPHVIDVYWAVVDAAHEK